MIAPLLTSWIRPALMVAVLLAPAAAFAQEVCGDGVEEGSEACDLGALNGQAGSCCSALCELVPSGTECRASAGSCDVAETCDGASAACPTDTFQPATSACRLVADLCD
ncbi:MAG: hypothetical protein ABFS46_14265, partial [Myxococcota bacterium]